MSEEEIKKKILEFLKKWQLAVISTIHSDRNAPESAVVAFTEIEDLKIVIGTSNTTRKYKNLQKNSHVSLVIGWDSNLGTVQYEGTARELDIREVEKYRELHVKKSPGSKQFMDLPDERYFLISPSWIRFTDNAGNPPEKYELSFS